jgi:hypothetical protein
MADHAISGEAVGRGMGLAPGNFIAA